MSLLFPVPICERREEREPGDDRVPNGAFASDYPTTASNKVVFVTICREVEQVYPGTGKIKQSFRKLAWRAALFADPRISRRPEPSCAAAA
jgi:hypothetical protein